MQKVAKQRTVRLDVALAQMRELVGLCVSDENLACKVRHLLNAVPLCQIKADESGANSALNPTLTYELHEDILALLTAALAAKWIADDVDHGTSHGRASAPPYTQGYIAAGMPNVGKRTSFISAIPESKQPAIVKCVPTEARSAQAPDLDPAATSRD